MRYEQYASYTDTELAVICQSCTWRREGGMSGVSSMLAVMIQSS
jgi:hypothetical protein